MDYRPFALRDERPGLLAVLSAREEEFKPGDKGMDSNEQWFAVKEVTERYGVSCDTIRRRIKKGKLRALRFPSVTSERNRIYDLDRIFESELQRLERGNSTN
jgi:hypothetical protein